MAKKRSLYLDKAAYANVPVAKREQVVEGRQGSRRIVRRHHLMADKIASLKQQIAAKGRFISPYGANRLYSMIVESLIALGENQEHNIGVAFGKFREITSQPSTLQGDTTAWDRFTKKEARNETTHLDALSRFIANIEVLQRLGGDHPYGLKLAQLGACIDILVDKTNRDVLLVRLRTGIAEGLLVEPLNENRKRKYSKTCAGVPSGIVVASDSDTFDE